MKNLMMSLLIMTSAVAYSADEVTAISTDPTAAIAAPAPVVNEKEVKAKEIQKQLAGLQSKLRALETIFASGSETDSKILAMSLPVKKGIILSLSKVTLMIDESSIPMITTLEKRIRDTVKSNKKDETANMCGNECMMRYEQIAVDRVTLAGIYRGEIAKKLEAYLELMTAK